MIFEYILAIIYAKMLQKLLNIKNFFARIKKKGA